MIAIPRPLRFCMITTFYPPYHFGGDAIFVYRLSNELARRGHRVEVIHCLDSYRLLGGAQPREEYPNHPNVVVHALKSRWGFLSPLSTFATGIPLLQRSAIQKILAASFDVIHYHNVSLVGGPKILEYGQAIKLYTPHEYWLVCPTHMLFRFRRAPCLRRDCVACSLIHGRPPQVWRYTGMLDQAVKHVDGFLGFTAFTQALHQREGLELPFQTLRSFAPPEDGEEEPLDQDGRKADQAAAPYFLYAGRLEKLKGVQTLIPLFRRYTRAQLWIAGTGSYEGRLRRMAEGIPNIRFIGHVPYPQLRTLYRNAIAVMVPSLSHEVSPLVVIEAASQSTPVIARNLGALPELVREMGGGIVYDREEEAVAAMDRLCSDSSFRNALGRSGKIATRERWSIEAHVSQYLSMIAGIADKRCMVF